MRLYVHERESVIVFVSCGKNAFVVSFMVISIGEEEKTSVPELYCVDRRKSQRVLELEDRI